MSSYHGWTHRPKAQGGTDPIPGVIASPLWPVNHYFAGVGLTGDQRESGWDMVQDAAAPGGLYRISPGNPPEDLPVDHLAFPIMLNSPVDFGQWQFRWNVERGPDCGEYRVEIASALVDGTYLMPSQGDDLTEGTCLTWLQLYPNSNIVTKQDLYQAASSWAASTTDMDAASIWCPQEFYRLTGAAGDVATTVTRLSTALGGDSFNGGPGLYWIRFRPTGTKHASSSALLIRVASLSVMLMPQTLDSGDPPNWCDFP